MPTDFDIKVSPSTRVPATSAPRPAEEEFPVPDHKASKPRGVKDAFRNRRSRGEDSDTSDGGRAGGPRDRRTTKTSAAAPRMPAKMGENIQTLWGTAGMIVMAACTPCGSAFLERAERLGQTGEELCRTSPSARRTYMMLTQGSTATAHFIEIGALLGTVAIHHLPGVRKQVSKLFGHENHEHGEEPQPAGGEEYGPEYAGEHASTNGQHSDVKAGQAA